MQAATLGQQLRRQACAAAAVLPLASTSFTSGSSGEIYFGLAKAVDVYLVILTVRILLSWFRNINWFGEPFNTLRQVRAGEEGGGGDDGRRELFVCAQRQLDQERWPPCLC